MRSASPLRYPGGKWRLADFFERLISLNFEEPPVYIEPYAGGASLALSLLFRGKVRSVYLNDLDPAVHAFWYVALNRTAEFIHFVRTVPVTKTEWRRQKSIHRKGTAAGHKLLGFATFYLNRTNHSGILNGGMIGGKDQSGTWKLDARFNRSELVRRLQRIAQHRSHIHLSNLDALDCVKRHSDGARKLVYLDPPYYNPGRHLYFNAYSPNDHIRVRDSLRDLRSWVVSYDELGEVRTLYRKYRNRRVSLLHTAREARKGEEILFFSSRLRIPAMPK